MGRSQHFARERKLLLAVVAVASGVTISCSDPGGIGVYNPGWDAAFEDAAKDAQKPFDDAATDASSDSPAEANADATDATSD
jgi:hypothetical protein